MSRKSNDRPEQFVNDVHSQLNRTSVSNIIYPQNIYDLQKIVQQAFEKNRPIAIAGKKHSMGGQQFLTENILIDMSKMNRVIDFQPEKFLISLEAGIIWTDLVQYTIAQNSEAGIRQKQTGADDLSIGGALASNIHGRGLAMKPIIDDVESFCLITFDGRLLNCSRHENSELFSLVIGGYGLFGIIASVKLRLMKRRKIQRVVRIENLQNLPFLFTQRINEGYLFGDFQFAIERDSPDFLNKGVFSCYLPVDDNISIAGNQRELLTDDWENLLFLAHTDKQKAFELYAAHYLATDGQIYWSDTHQLSPYLNSYHHNLDIRLKTGTPGSEMITEVYVPLEKLSEFMQLVREDFRRHNTNLIYGTIRIIRRDNESYLAWAREDSVCIVFNLHIEHSPNKIAKAQAEFRLLIDRAIQFNGSFYLTYHRWATKEQILNCYPQIKSFLTLKKLCDPMETFQSDWYLHYKRLLTES